jgi:hypothetical protein
VSGKSIRFILNIIRRAKNLMSVRKINQVHPEHHQESVNPDECQEKHSGSS